MAGIKDSKGRGQDRKFGRQKQPTTKPNKGQSYQNANYRLIPTQWYVSYSRKKQMPYLAL